MYIQAVNWLHKLTYHCYYSIYVIHTAVEAQILMQEDLTGITSIRFPTLTNTSADISLVFGGMTPTIEIPSTIILRQLEEGI